MDQRGASLKGSPELLCDLIASVAREAFLAAHGEPCETVEVGPVGDLLLVGYRHDGWSVCQRFDPRRLTVLDFLGQLVTLAEIWAERGSVAAGPGIEVAAPDLDLGVPP